MAEPKARPDAKAQTTPLPAPQSSPEVVAASVVTPPLATQAGTQPAASARSPRWLTALLLLGLLAILFWVLYRGFASEPNVANAPSATPAAGGMVVESTKAITGTTAGTGAAIASSSEPTKPAGLQPGQTVAASSAGELRLYSDPSTTSPIRDVYATDALFTVLEPSGQYTEYPVLVNDQPWYRVRAADGLVGWAMQDAFAPASAAPQATATATS
ncbi:hypothetical protein BH10CHL1_BH10CHL1_43770 [soil metagenome]